MCVYIHICVFDCISVSENMKRSLALMLVWQGIVCVFVVLSILLLLLRS